MIAVSQHTIFTPKPSCSLLPADISAFEEAAAREPQSLWVRKLVLGSDGRGIKIFRADNSRALEEVRTLAKSMEQNWLVQRYISNPMLFDGHKFDFRIHVMVASAEPLRVLVAKEGLAKLSFIVL
jgi:tubulin polyglutamylase TTLL5